MRVKCFLTREDAMIHPEPDQEFRYENGWPFLEIITAGQTSKLINKNCIVEMEIECDQSNEQQTENEKCNPRIDRLENFSS